MSGASIDLLPQQFAHACCGFRGRPCSSATIRSCVSGVVAQGASGTVRAGDRIMACTSIRGDPPRFRNSENMEAGNEGALAVAGSYRGGSLHKTGERGE